MGKLVFITGGARSGKSAYAQDLLKSLEGNTVFIASGVAFDEGMKDRIAKHRLYRPDNWKTIETYKDFNNLGLNKTFQESDNVLFDCITVMVCNQLLDFNLNWEQIDINKIDESEKKIIKDVRSLMEQLEDKNAVIVSNEIGSGIIPDNYFSSYYRDILGRINQLIANYADEVILMVSGIPVKVK